MTFFTDILPDPVNRITVAGNASGAGLAGPGFAKIKFSSNNQVQMSKTKSGRAVSTTLGGHSWEFSINYNPLTRDEFEPISNFLEYRRGRLYPFYVILPQYNIPKDPTFASYVESTNPTISTTYDAGSEQVMLSIPSGNGTPSPGDYFNINDPAHIDHLKTYKVVRVETNALYNTDDTQPTVNQCRITLIPELSKDLSVDAEFIFHNPKFRVVQKGDTIEYDLDTDNLYQFSLNLEEVLP